MLWLLARDRFPERDLALGWPVDAVPYAALAAACLIKLDQGLAILSSLRRNMVEQPALTQPFDQSDVAYFLPLMASERYKEVCRQRTATETR